MAFKDITKVMYDGKVKIDYKDGNHAYYARMRKDWDLPEDNKDAWEKPIRPKGTTTLLGDTLEKKGLMLWPMGMALRELFGFYDFTNENGEKMTGFSKDVGTMWATLAQVENGAHNELGPGGVESILLPVVQSASKAHTRHKKKGADIGNVVHDAIEHMLNDEAFDIAESYMWGIKNAEYESEEAQKKAFEDFDADVAKATLAFKQFESWWLKSKAEMIGSEQIVYSMEHNICGTYDALIKLDGRTILCDFKTSNASKSKEACMPEGVSYDYFIQSAIYAMIVKEMNPKQEIDDLLIVSCRKDGGFTTIFASELGLTVQDCIDWALSVIKCYRMREKTRAGLVAHASEEGAK